jgi:hypothetical protein
MAKVRATADDLGEFLARIESKVFQIPPRQKETSALERLLALVLQGEHGPFATGERSVRALKEAFAHWNEVRVARGFEVQDALAQARVGDAQARAVMAQEYLRRVFGLQNHLELDWLYDASPERRGKLLTALAMAPHHASTALDLDALEGSENSGQVPLTPGLKRLFARLGMVGVNPKEAAVRELLDPVTRGKQRYPNYLALCALARLMPVTKPARCRRTEALLEAFRGRNTLADAALAALLLEVGYDVPLAGAPSRSGAAAKKPEKNGKPRAKSAS